MHPLRVSLIATAMGVLIGIGSKCGVEFLDKLSTPERGLSQPAPRGFEGMVDPRTREVFIPKSNPERR